MICAVTAEGVLGAGLGEWPSVVTKRSLQRALRTHSTLTSQHPLKDALDRCDPGGPEGSGTLLEVRLLDVPEPGGLTRVRAYEPRATRGLRSGPPAPLPTAHTPSPGSWGQEGTAPNGRGPGV